MGCMRNCTAHLLFCIDQYWRNFIKDIYYLSSAARFWRLLYIKRTFIFVNEYNKYV